MEQLATYLDRPPTEDEVLRAVIILFTGKSPGADSNPPGLNKEGGNQLYVRRLSRSSRYIYIYIYIITIKVSTMTKVTLQALNKI